MAASLSTLGIGSGGALSFDVIDQLKDADKASIIKPIEQKIELNGLKSQKLTDLKKLISEMNTEVVSMSDPTLYNTKESSVSGSSVSIEATDKALESNFSLDVKNLATHDIKQSQQGYGYEDALFGEGTMTLQLGDQASVSIDITSTDSLKDVAKKIDEATNGKVEASILNVGGSDPYKLILKSKDTGSDNNITITGDYDFDQVGEGAKDATFNYNGIDITRASNKIDDLIEGVTITLESEGVTNVSIKADNSKLIEGMDKFVEKYNAFVKGFSDSTKFDKTSNTAGLFQGDSSIRSAQSRIKDAFMLSSNGGKSLNDFGMEIQRDGTIQFDKTKFEEVLKDDPKSVEDFFRGTDGRNGAFNRLDSAIFDVKTSSSGPLRTLSKDLEDSAKRLEEQQKSAQKKLDDRYNIMAKKFAAYDSVIAKLTAQGDSLTAIIDAELAAKN